MQKNTTSLRSSIRKLARKHAPFLLGYGLVVLIWNYPLVANFRTHVIGRAFDDVFEVLWQISWHETALFDQHVNPFFSQTIFYPHGWHLASGAQPVWYLLPLAIISYVTTPTIAYNIALLTLLILAGFGAYLLAYRITADRFASFVAGCIYITAPVVTMRLGGHLQILISIQWLPYAYLAFYQMLNSSAKHRYRWAILSGVLLSFTILGHWYFLFIATLPMLGLFACIRRADISWSLLKALGITAVTTLIILTPFALITWFAREAMFPNGGVFSLQSAEANAISISRLFAPNPFHGFWGEWSRNLYPLSAERDIISVGYASFLLMLVGIYFAPKRASLPFILVAGIALILAMGASLHWNNQPVLIQTTFPVIPQISEHLLSGINYPDGMTGIPLPGAILFNYLPFYEVMRVVARYTIPFMLATAVLASYGVHYLSQRIKPKWLIPLIAVTLILAEGWLTPYIDFTEVAVNERPHVTDWLNTLPEETAIIEYPRPVVSKLAMYSQSLHGRSVVNGYMSFIPDHLREVDQDLGKWPSSSSIDILRDWNVDYIFVSGSANEDFQTNILPELLDNKDMCLIKTFEEGVMYFSQTYVFALLDYEESCSERLD